MAEQNPIKYSDLILPDDSIENLIKQLTELQDVFTGTVTSVKSQAASMAASLKSVSGATEQGRNTTKGAASDADRLAKAYKDLEFAMSENGKMIASLQRVKSEQRREDALQEKLNRSLEGSYDALSAQYSLNKMRINQLSRAERENDEEAKKLIADTKAIYDEMNKLQQQTGKFALNVGNYEQSITNALGAQSKWFQGMQRLGALFEGGFTNGVKMAGNAVAGFGKQLLALLMNPIVATIAGITAAFMALAKGISSSEENTMALQRVLAPFQRVLTGIVSVLQTAAEWLLKGVEGMEKLAMGASRLMEKLPLVGNSIRNVNNALAENIELTRRKQLLDLAERNNTVEQAKLARDVAKVRNNAAKESDPQKRAMLLANATALEHKIMLNEIALAKEDLAIKKAQAEQAKNNKEANDALAAAQARLYKAEENYYSRTMRMQSQMRTLNEKGSGTTKIGESAADRAKREAEEEARIQEQKAKRQKEAIRAMQDEQAKLIEDGYDRQRVQTIYQYDRQIEDLKEALTTLGDDEIETRKAYIARIEALEQQKWDKLADIADQAMKDAREAEKRDLDMRLKATEKMIREKKQKEEQQEKEEKDARERRKQAISESLQFSLDSLHEFLDAWLRTAEAKKEAADEEVDRTKSALDAEIEARNNGYAFNVAQAQKEYDLAKRNQQKALKEQQRAQKAQEALDTATQVSSLITATAEIWKAYAGIPFAGTGLAIAATALMWSSFLAAKVMAANAAGAGTEEYGEGTVELLQGGSHQSGNDIDLGRKKDGTRRRAEGGEFFAVINKRNSRKYRDIIPEVVGALNDGTFAEKYMSAYGGQSVAVNVGQAPDISRLADDVHTIRRQGETERFVDGSGRTVTQYKNLKRTILN